MSSRTFLCIFPTINPLILGIKIFEVKSMTTEIALNLVLAITTAPDLDTQHTFCRANVTPVHIYSAFGPIYLKLKVAKFERFICKYFSPGILPPNHLFSHF